MSLFQILQIALLGAAAVYVTRWLGLGAVAELCSRTKRTPQLKLHGSLKLSRHTTLHLVEAAGQLLAVSECREAGTSATVALVKAAPAAPPASGALEAAPSGIAPNPAPAGTAAQAAAPGARATAE